MFDTEKTDDAFDDGYKALGQVVYFFQQLEEELKRAVSFLIDPAPGASDAAEIVVCELSFKQLVHIGYSLLPLFKVKDPAKALSDLKAVLALALKAEEHRNTLLHSTFGVSIDEEPTFQRSKQTAKYKRGLRETGEALESAKVERYLIEIGSVGARISDFMGETFPRWRVRQWAPE